jgi:GNAT superfamily N-acetyltransferase
MTDGLPSHSSDDLRIRPARATDLAWIRQVLDRHWGSTAISSLGVIYPCDTLPALIAEDHDGPVGLVTYTFRMTGVDGGGIRQECEIVTLSSEREGRGIATALLGAVVEIARARGCRRVMLTTTNDNLRAIGFYQKRGWSLVAVHRGAMDRARELKPEIPLIGMNGIRLRDEIELELRLDGPSPGPPGRPGVR